MDRAKTVAGLIALGLLASCARAPRIVVGSKNFTEQVLLGEIVAQHIEQRMGVIVDRKLNLGGTLLAHEALVKGSIDLYPEYTGTALTAILKQTPARDPSSVFETVRQAYQRQWRLVWLTPLGFNDTFAMIVRGDVARAGHIGTLSEAAAARSWRLGAGYEFQQRPDGLAGLLQTYGLRTEGAPVAMDLGLLYSALTSGKVDMIAANSTDGLAGALDVAVLADDRHYFPPYECSVVAREETLIHFPQLRGVLQELSGKLPDATMRRLNNEVDGKHRSVAETAADFLRQSHL
ncbi:MAG TPA: glycine betaine ABC transporter substrate-binding protein [Bryobacteraceae bacterium]